MRPVNCLSVVTLCVFAANVGAAVPTSQPAPAQRSVLIEPFQPVDPAEASPALSRGLSTHLQSALARRSFTPVIDTATCDDPASAMSAGRKANSAFVVYGSYQRVEKRVRFDGGVVDVSTGKVLAGLTATGDVADPFDCQDKIAAQAVAGLRGSFPDTSEPAVSETPAAPTIQPAYAPLAAMLDRNRTPSNEYGGHAQRSLDRQTYYPGVFGYGGYFGAGGYGGFGGFGVFGPGATIGGTNYSSFGYFPYANYRVGYGIGGGAPR